MEDLRFIRKTMERGAAFTAVPGWGGVGMGVTALFAAALASSQPTPDRWLLVWALEAVLAIVIGIFAIQRKAHRARLPVLSGAGRKFILSFLPPALAGVAMTAALWKAGAYDLLPGSWLLLYGAAVVTAGTFSVKIIPVMGICFMVFGVVALLAMPTASDLSMALGFGGLHIGFGVTIARRHGG
jgi:FtsH-binding integral membrane protein